MVYLSYVGDHVNPKITNNMTTRTYECIYLRPTVNLQGTQKFFFLNTIRLLKKRKIIPIISPYQVISKVGVV